MPRSRTSAADLARLLNSTSEAIYVLDDERQIVFCNAACALWTGASVEQLIGVTCNYCSGSDLTDADRVAAALCPPPEVFAGQRVVAEINLAITGQPRPRQVEFIPLVASTEDYGGVIALVQAENAADYQPSSPAHPAPEAAQLHQRLQRFRQELARHFHVDRLVGDSPAMKRVRAQVTLAAANHAHVLVVGPPGSGREHVAKAIHYSRERQSLGSLTPLDCDVLAPDVVRSTLASFSARYPARASAATDTLLLHQVDRLDGEIQAYLAELLERGVLGARVIATARQPLAKLAADGVFRYDLACALGVLEIALPPLAERAGDIPLLAQWFLEEMNGRGGKQLGGFTPEALDRLTAHPWRGNVDELAQVVREAHGRAERLLVGVGDLPPRLHWAADAAERPRRSEEPVVLEQLLGQIEVELIRRALARAKGNKTKAARLLGMTRPRLYRRLVQLGLDDGKPAD